MKGTCPPATRNFKLVVDAKTMESVGVSGSGDVMAETINAKTFQGQRGWLR